MTGNKSGRVKNTFSQKWRIEGHKGPVDVYGVENGVGLKLKVTEKEREESKRKVGEWVEE